MALPGVVIVRECFIFGSIDVTCESARSELKAVLALVRNFARYPFISFCF